MTRQPEITYGVASNCYTKTVELNGFMVQYMTPFIDNYLQWMISELYFDLREEARMECIRAAWNTPKRTFGFRGGFREEQYKKVQEYFNTNPGFSESFTECRIPKVKLRTVYPINP